MNRILVGLSFCLLLSNQAVGAGLSPALKADVDLVQTKYGAVPVEFLEDKVFDAIQSSKPSAKARILRDSARIFYQNERARVQAILRQIDADPGSVSLDVLRDLISKGPNYEYKLSLDQRRRIENEIKGMDRYWQMEKTNCGGAVDFESKFGPPRDQGDLPNCYAQVAADLIQSENPGAERPSAEYLALKEFKEKGIWDRGGDPEQIIESFMKSGGKYCSERDLPPANAGGESIRQAWRDIEKLRFEVSHLRTRGEMERIDSVCQKVPNSFFPNLKSSDVRKILAGDNFSESLPWQLVQENCQGKLKTSKQFSLSYQNHVDRMPYHFLDREKVGASLPPRSEEKNNLLAHLNSGKPVALGINTAALDKDLSGFSVASSDNFHAILLVGKRWNEKLKRCEVKVRNSWGKPAEWKSAKQIFSGTLDFLMTKPLQK